MTLGVPNVNSLMNHSFTCCLWSASLAALLALGCTKSATGDAAADPQVKQYSDGLQALLDDNYLEANTKFDELSNKTLDQTLQELAQLRLGDTLFYQGRYREAAEVYREYLTQHDDSPDAPHAAYMRGLAFLRRCPEESWIKPPAESREMSDVELAYTSLLFLVQRYPDSYHALRAKYQVASVIQRRCRNHLYVAEYYVDRDVPAGTIQRLEQGLSMEENERKAGYLGPTMVCIATPRTLELLATAYVEVNDPEGFWRTIKRVDRLPATTPEQRATLLASLRVLAQKKGWNEPSQP